MDHGFDRQVHVLFERAVELTGAERESFLDSACEGDARLRTQVEQLLKWDEDAGDFLEQGPVVGSLEAPGMQIGAYTLIREIGEGGMAVVWLASQSSPVSRHVAVKMLKPGMDTRSILSRFELERQVLAHLDHPHVASVFDAGMTEQGRPYFVMEYVDGTTLTAYCREHALGIVERLRLFMQVCDVVQHAHQKGVIHRDIKPTNILVSTESGTPKVIDFGIAKAMAGTLREGSVFTEHGQVVGTPEYMSPEQCSGGVDAIDVRSDVYSLGVVLYELLCDGVPYNLDDSSIHESMRIIRHDPVIRPSSIDRRLAGDLETILLKSLEKRPEDRYQTARDFKRDIERYLEHQPIEARPRSIIYHLTMFTRRHRPFVAAAAVALISLLVVVVVSWQSAFVARRALHESEQRERELEVVISFQESLLRDIDVQEMGQLLKRALSEAIGPDADEAELAALIDDVNFTSIGLRLVDEGILERAQASINERFREEPVLRARLLHNLAGTMNLLGLVGSALPILEQSLAIREGTLGADHEDTIQSMHAVGSVLSTLGQFDESLGYLEEAYARSTRVFGPDDRMTLRIGTSLGGLHRRRGDEGEAERVWMATLERQRRVLGEEDDDTQRTMNNVGIVLAVQGRLDEAEAMWRSLLEVRRRAYGGTDPRSVTTMGNLARLHSERGDMDAAVPLLREALAAERSRLGDTHTSTLQTMAMLVQTLMEAGELDDAERLGRECLAGRLDKLGPINPDTLRSKGTLGRILHRRGDPDGERILQATFDVQLDTLGLEHPDTMWTLDWLSEVAEADGRLDVSLERSRESLEASIRALPEDHWETGVRRSRFGKLLGLTGDVDEGSASMHQGYDILFDGLGPEHPETRKAAKRLAEFYSTLDAQQPGEGHGASAEAWRLRSEDSELAAEDTAGK